MLKKKTSDPTNEEQQTAQLVNERLEALLLSRELPSALHEAITYSIFPNGKRFRSKFAIFLARDLGLSDDQILEAACSVELIHCASLIHDDLPALDNDEMRRGKPSCHIAFSEATAILAGDTMISLALELAAHHKGDKGREYTVYLPRAFTDLCAGQKLDLSPEQEREVLEIHRLKTGALLLLLPQWLQLGLACPQLDVKSSDSLVKHWASCFKLLTTIWISTDLKKNAADREAVISGIKKKLFSLIWVKSTHIKSLRKLKKN
ncbi:MAG: polyprenyl synthetase family protein [Bdellovibrionota bacterium]